MWLFVVTFVITFQCHSAEAFWLNADTPPSCLEYGRVLLGYEITNLILDVVILCIPVTAVSRLCLSRPKRVALIGVFLLGGL